MAASLLNTSVDHKYPRANLTLSTALQVGDVMVCCVSTAAGSAATATWTGAGSGTFVAQASVVGPSAAVTILTGVIATAGTPTIVASNQSDTGFTVLAFRGLSSGTAHKSGSSAAAISPQVVSLSPTVDCVLVTCWGTETTGGFTTFSTSQTTFQSDGSHADAQGYNLLMAGGGGPYSCGTNVTSATTANSTVVVMLPIASGAVTHTSTGAIVGSGAVLVGSATHKAKHTTSGAITGPGAAVAGTSAHKTKHTTSGAIAGPGSALAGGAKRFRAHGASGVLTGAGAALAGIARRFRSHGSSGAIAGPGATLAGTAAHSAATGSHATAGALIGPGAMLAGGAQRTSGSTPPVYSTPPTIYPQGPLNPSLTTGGGSGSPQEWRIELPRMPVKRLPVFRRNMENRDRADIEDITQILQFLNDEGP